MTKEFATVVIVLELWCSGSASAQRRNRCLIDTDKNTIGSVSLKDSFQQLSNRFGSSNVTRSTEQLEGESSPMIIVKIDGHRITQHWNHVSTDDPVFKTKEGVGEGSPVTVFSRHYGEPSLGDGEQGIDVNFRSQKGAEFQVAVSQECLASDHTLKVGPRCRVKRILVIG